MQQIMFKSGQPSALIEPKVWIFWNELMPLDASFHEDLTRFLPAPLLERLPDLGAITEALQHLGSLYKALTSFLPLYIAEDEVTRSPDYRAVSYTHLRAHETDSYLVCR